MFVFALQFLLFSCKNNKKIEFNDKGIYGAFFNDKFQKYFVGNGKGNLFVLDYNFNIIEKKQFAYGPVATCISSPDNEYMINTSGDGTLYIWRVTEDSLSIYYKEKIHNSSSMTCLFSPLMNYAVSTGHDSAVVILDWKNKSVIKKLRSNCGTIRFAWFSSDDKYLLWADDKGYFFKTETNTWDTKQKKITNAAINCMVSNLDNTEIICAAENGKVYVLSFLNLHILQEFKAHQGSAFVAELYDCERKKISTSGYDRYLTFWEKDSKGIYKYVKKIKAHNSPCCTLYYNDDCTKLLSGGQDGWIKVWDAKSLKLIHSKNIYE